jgi:LPXTG-motif cell wall-anchored protein
MTEARQSNIGASLFVVGVVIMVVGLLGISTTGEADWVSAVIGFVGALISGAGLYLVSRRNGTSGTRHSAS